MKTKRIIEVSDTLPPLGVKKRKLINKKELLEISEKIKLILEKESKVTSDENFSSNRNSFSC